MFKPFKYITSFIVLSFLFAFCSTAHKAYAEPKSIMPAGDVPTKINADNMDYNAEKNTIIFSGKVYVERAEFSLWADTITVYLQASDKKVSEEESMDPMASMQAGDIDKIIADDNVRMKYNSNTGKAGRAVYDAPKALLVMQENPVLMDGDNSITGEEIRYYLNENRSEVVGGNKRVEAFFSSSPE